MCNRGTKMKGFPCTKHREGRNVSMETKALKPTTTCQIIGAPRPEIRLILGWKKRDPQACLEFYDILCFIGTNYHWLSRCPEFMLRLHHSSYHNFSLEYVLVAQKI